jgi:hypothetical protein
LLFTLRGDLQRTQTLGPEDLEGRPELGDGFGARAVQALRPLPPLGDEAGLLQDAKVLGDRRPSDVEAARDVADRELLARDEAKDLAAAWLAEGGKCVDFLRVSRRLLKVKAGARLVGTDSRLNHDRSGRSPRTQLARAFRISIRRGR